MARSLQRFVYETVGKEFFTYLSIFIFSVSLATLIFFLLIRVKVRQSAQYMWLLVCGSLYIYFTFQLREHPEEALHLVEYGLLSFFVFNALRHKIRDWTIYLTTPFIVLFFGVVDEVIQWLIPLRYWGLKDVWINVLASLIFILAIWRGIRPENISQPVSHVSVRILTGIMAVNLLLIGFCFSNTPAAVNRYTEKVDFLSWLRHEEAMTEYGYEHVEPDVGVFYSRFTLDKLEEIDQTKGHVYGKIIPADISLPETRSELLKTYNPNTNPFLYEFLVHLFRRDTHVRDYKNSDDSPRLAQAAAKENSIIEQYFITTLQNTPFKWSQSEKAAFNKKSQSWKEVYKSATGRMITAFDVKTAQTVTLFLLFLLWICGELWQKKLRRE